MLCMKKNVKPMKSQKGGAFIVGLLIGSAATATFCIVKKIKKKKKERSGASKIRCDCTDNSYENFCNCDEGADDYERARNGCGNLSGTEKCDTDILHTHGCLGYPHDEYEGFADSNGDRPNDLSNPEIDNQKGIPEGNPSPYWAKNKRGKSNPQPENKVNEVKKK